MNKTKKFQNDQIWLNIYGNFRLYYELMGFKCFDH